MKKKRVAILVDLELSKKSGGHVKFWERICESLKNKSLDVKLDLFFLGKKKKKIKFDENINFYILKPIFSSRLLKFIGIDADYTDLFPFNPLLLFKLRNYDLIHSTDQLFSMSRAAKIASKIWKIPLTSSVHTDTPSYTEYYILKIFLNFHSFFKKILIEKIKLQKIISTNQKKKINKYFASCKNIMIDVKNLEKNFLSKDLSKKFIQLERGVEKKIFTKKIVNRNNIFKKYNLPNKKKIIFFCGRIHTLKGAVFLSKVHKKLEKCGIDLITILAGENIHGNTCKEIGGPNLKIVNYLDENEIATFMSVCDLFVFPSLYEIGPQVILEAKACQAVCVVSPQGGGKRIIHNFDGIIINKYSVVSWANEVLNLLDNSKKINKIKKNLSINNTQLTWRDVFFEIFYKNWKKFI